MRADHLLNWQKLMIFLLVVAFSSCQLQEDGCHFYFVKQPSPNTSCNPWSLLNVGESTLPLYCHIQVPKNDHLPDIEWYKKCDGTSMQVYPGGINPKYTNPVSSRDDIDFKFINFSLIIHNVSDSDVCCYSCNILFSNHEKCTVSLRASSEFCLLEESKYNENSNCKSLPVNEDTVCMTTESCTLTSNEVHLIPVLISSTENFHSLLQHPITENTHSTGTLKMEVFSTVSIQRSPIISSHLDNHTPVKKIVSKRKIKSKALLNVMKTPHSQQELRIGLYVGVGVCCLLLIVILVLLAIVAVLCKAPRARKQRARPVAMSNGQQLNHIVWKRPSFTVTSLINEGCMIPAPAASPTAVTQSVRVNSGQSVRAASGTHSRPPLRIQKDSVQTTSGTVNHNHSESSNHDSHYYHILEPSQDYNLNWLASDTEDRELLLQSWREGQRNAYTSSIWTKEEQAGRHQ